MIRLKERIGRMWDTLNLITIVFIVFVAFLLSTSFSYADIGENMEYEVEPNSKHNVANKIYNDCTVSGYLEKSDIDCFKFTLYSESTINIIGIADKRTTRLGIRNSNDEMLIATGTTGYTDSGNYGFDFSYTLPAGEYHVLLIDSDSYNTYNEYMFYFSYNGHVHSYTYDTEVIPATCCEEGYRLDICSCGRYKVTPLPIGDHDIVEVVRKASTTKDGEMYLECDYCGMDWKDVTSTKIYRISTVKLQQSIFTYDGKVKSPKIRIKDRKGNVLQKNVDYTVSVPNGRKNVGKYTYTVKFKGDYTGTKKLTFKINPKATSVKSITKGKKSFTVRWGKISKQATGYEIMYATNSKFTKNKKTVKVNSYKTTSKKITKLSAKKTYYVKVRTYKTVNGVKYYSNWSKYKKVTTK